MNCRNYANCPKPANSPLIGYDSETDDVEMFTAMGYGPLVPPPLGWQFGRATAFAIRQSSVSQEAAEQAAIAAAIAEAESTWVNPVGVPPLIWGG